ncbi:hypothetical protein ACFLR7_04660 [Acidobacteriota bacterium]
MSDPTAFNCREAVGSSLFESYRVKTRRISIREALEWLKINSSSFRLAVISSIVFHSFVITSLVLHSSMNRQSENNDTAIYQTLFVSDVVHGENPTGLEALPDAMKNELAEALRSMNFTGTGLEEAEKSDLFRMMGEAFLEHMMLSGNDPGSGMNFQDDFQDFIENHQTWELENGKTVYSNPDPSGTGGTLMSTLPAGTRREIDYLQRVKPLKQNFILEGQQVRINTSRGIKYAPAGYFFREPHYEELISAGAGMFYVTSGFPLTWEPHAVESASPVPEADIASLLQGGEGFKVVLLGSSPPESGGAITAADEQSTTKSFTASDRQIAEIVNDLMRLPELEQIRRLKQDYLEVYDLEDEALIRLTRRFLRLNLSNVFIILSDISAAFDFVEEVYFNKPLYRELFDFWVRYPESTVGREFLLCLASHYDFERRALRSLNRAFRGAREYVGQRFTVAEIYDKKAKCYALVEIHKGLSRRIAELGYSSWQEVYDKYIEEEARIYNLLIAMGGRAENIGLFALGCLYWDSSQFEKAIQTWSKTDPGYTDNAALLEIRNVLLQYEDLARIRAQVDSILEWHSGKDSKSLLARMVKFGKWEIRYSTRTER